MKLTDTQMQILAAAAEQQDRLVKPPAIPSGPRGAIEAKLRTAGLMEQVRLDADDRPAMAWRHVEGEAIAYRITAAGLAAIGADAGEPTTAVDQTQLAGLRKAEVAAEQDLVQRASDACIDATAQDALGQAQLAAEADMPHGGAAESAEGGEPSAGTSLAEMPPEPLTAPPESRTGLLAAQPRRALLAAAQTVLLAWDDEAGQRAGLPDAVAALRSALAEKPARQPRDPSAPRKPREGTKQQQVLALLRRPEGATIAQVTAATGWQAHTVRGFFAGLKKRQGIAVEVLERVRQVGPNKEGAKGSFSIYRVADAG
jgi:hypothetical protein